MTTKDAEMLKLLAGLTGSSGARIDRIKTNSHSLELFVFWDEPEKGFRICPDCGSTHCNKKDNGTMQTIRHIPINGKGSMITFHKPRFKCCSCGKTFYIHPDFACPGMSVSKHLFVQIFDKLTSTDHSLTTIARETLSSRELVSSVMDLVCTERPSSLPTTLGNDEFKGDTGIWDPERKRYLKNKYHCSITDNDGTKAVIIDIVFDPKASGLKSYFMEYPRFQREKVKFFCTDMRPGFSKTAKYCFPNAKICIDPFHVIQLLTNALNEVKTAEAKRLKSQIELADPAHKQQAEEDYDLVKGCFRLLITSPYNKNRLWNKEQNQKRKEERLSRIFYAAPDLQLLYNALQDFNDVTHMDSFREKQHALTAWLNRYLACESPELQTAAKTIRKNRTGIENAWHYHKSNSPTEGRNKCLKDLKRLQFGAHSFENFRKRALLAFGYISFVPELYTIKKEKGASE